MPPQASRGAGLPCADAQQHVQLRRKAALQLRPQRILRRKRVGARGGPQLRTRTKPSPEAVVQQRMSCGYLASAVQPTDWKSM